MAVTFGILNDSPLRYLPVFSNSLWNRFGVIFDFSIAILAAVFIHFCLRWATLRPSLTKVAIILAVLVIAYQIRDQARFFRHFNAAIPREIYYPQTPTISYVQKNLRPLEYVIADASYAISGTLSGYLGISEWFAHEFRPEATKKVLRQIVSEPFPTPTSALFSGNQIDMTSPYMRALGIRYVAMRSQDGLAIKDKVQGQWRAMQFEPAVTLFEAVNPIQGPYFVPSLDSSPNDLVVSSKVKAELLDNTTWIVSARAERPGWIVLPVQTSKEWIAEVNGIPVTLGAYLGMLPAFPVREDQENHIVYRFDFSSYKYASAVSFLGFIVFVALGILISITKKPGPRAVRVHANN